MKKDLAVIFGLFAVIVVLIVFGQGFTTASFISGRSAEPLFGRAVLKTTPVSIRGLTLKVMVANTASLRKTGLSKMQSLPLDSGMLFVFDSSGPFAIWMKDMKFAIDIIWLDDSKNIVDMVQNVPPEPKKKDADLTIYRPRFNAKYVLEVNAGISSLNNLAIGDKVLFTL